MWQPQHVYRNRDGIDLAIKVIFVFKTEVIVNWVHENAIDMPGICQQRIPLERLEAQADCWEDITEICRQRTAGSEAI